MDASNRKKIKAALFYQKVEAIIAEHYMNPNFGLTELSSLLCLSRTQVYRNLQVYTSTSPSILIRQYRLNKAINLLEDSSHSIAEIAYKVGFQDASYFTKVFKETYGFLPSEY